MFMLSSWFLSAFCLTRNGGAGEKAEQWCGDWRHTPHVDTFTLMPSNTVLLIVLGRHSFILLGWKALDHIVSEGS